MPDTPVAYSPRDAARTLGISRTVVYELIARGEVRAKKLGARTLILRADLERYAASLPEYEPGSAA